MLNAYKSPSPSLPDQVISVSIIEKGTVAHAYRHHIAVFIVLLFLTFCLGTGRDVNDLTGGDRGVTGRERVKVG